LTPRWCRWSITRAIREGVSYKHYPNLIEMAKDVDTLIAITRGPSTAKDDQRRCAEGAWAARVFINVARGSVADEDALIAALKDGTIMAAGLDVFANEPEVPDALKAMQNVVLLPHIASASITTRNAMDQLVVDNLKLWFEGKAPMTPIAETPVKGADGDTRCDGRTPETVAERAAYLLALATIVLGAPNAAAQDARSLTSEMVGQWELSTAGRDKTCVVTLKNEASPQGLKLELEKGATLPLPRPLPHGASKALILCGCRTRRADR
jgi:hypothetical protein